MPEDGYIAIVGLVITTLSFVSSLYGALLKRSYRRNLMGREPVDKFLRVVYQVANSVSDTVARCGGEGDVCFQTYERVCSRISNLCESSVEISDEARIPILMEKFRNMGEVIKKRRDQIRKLRVMRGGR
ncbi:MAG: hypothetical protein KJ626_04100 [Verrucomicrobia bacterium]|nr:hypothetical protein [Verrucomicrobiota bacterium]